jgi:cobalt/nickel transport system permease protein
MLLHIAAFQLDRDSHQKTPWHSLAPHTRLLCTLLSVFAIALTPNGRWWTWAIYSLGIFGIIGISRVTWQTLIKRVAIEFAFVGTILLGTLLREGGQVLWSWGVLKITTTGLTVLGSVAWKGLLSLLIVNVLILTTSIPDLLNAFIALKTPPLLVAIMSSMYRYLGILVGEFHAMRRAAIARNLMVSRHSSRIAIGNMMGVLFIRTYDRGERVYQAMLARGYQGQFFTPTLVPQRQRDIAVLVVTGIVALLGQIVYLNFQ